MSDLACEIQLISKTKDTNHSNATNKQTNLSLSNVLHLSTNKKTQLPNKQTNKFGVCCCQALLAECNWTQLKISNKPINWNLLKKLFSSINRFLRMKKMRKTSHHCHKCAVHLLADGLMNWYCIKFEARSVQTTCKMNLKFFGWNGRLLLIKMMRRIQNTRQASKA